MKGSFNIRVYGILIEEEKLLLIREPYAGQKFIIKFPGGGLEFGEGLIDCLKREFLEELNLNLSYIEHLYTTDFFQESAFRDNEQLISIYYEVKTDNIDQLKVIDIEIEELIWMSINDITEEFVSLPVDKKIIEILTKKHKSVNKGFA